MCATHLILCHYTVLFRSCTVRHVANPTARVFTERDICRYRNLRMVLLRGLDHGNCHVTLQSTWRWCVYHAQRVLNQSWSLAWVDMRSALPCLVYMYLYAKYCQWWWGGDVKEKPRMGSRLLMHRDLLVDFGNIAMCIYVTSFLTFFLTFSSPYAFFLTYLLPCWFTSWFSIYSF